MPKSKRAKTTDLVEMIDPEDESAADRPLLGVPDEDETIQAEGPKSGKRGRRRRKDEYDLYPYLKEKKSRRRKSKRDYTFDVDDTPLLEKWSFPASLNFKKLRDLANIPTVRKFAAGNKSIYARTSILLVLVVILIATHALVRSTRPGKEEPLPPPPYAAYEETKGPGTGARAPMPMPPGAYPSPGAPRMPPVDATFSGVPVVPMHGVPAPPPAPPPPPSLLPVPAPLPPAAPPAVAPIPVLPQPAPPQSLPQAPPHLPPPSAPAVTPQRPAPTPKPPAAILTPKEVPPAQAPPAVVAVPEHVASPPSAHVPTVPQVAPQSPVVAPVPPSVQPSREVHGPLATVGTSVEPDSESKQDSKPEKVFDTSPPASPLPPATPLSPPPSDKGRSSSRASSTRGSPLSPAPSVASSREDLMEDIKRGFPLQNTSLRKMRSLRKSKKLARAPSISKVLLNAMAKRKTAFRGEESESEVEDNDDEWDD